MTIDKEYKLTQYIQMKTLSLKILKKAYSAVFDNFMFFTMRFDLKITVKKQTLFEFFSK